MIVVADARSRVVPIISPTPSPGWINVRGALQKETVRIASIESIHHLNKRDLNRR